MSRTWTIPATIFVSPSGVRGCSSMVEPLPSKQITRVRFPSSAPALGKPRAKWPGAFALHPHAHAVSGNMGGYRTLRVAMWRWLLLVDPRVVWAPGLAVGPGCAVGGPRASIGASARCPARPRRPRAPRPGPPDPPTPSMLAAVGVLQH